MGIGRLRILGADWRVTFDQDEVLKSKDLDGECNYNRHVIAVMKERVVERQKKVLWHEITHACAEALGLTEIQVGMLSAHQFQVLMDNPDLLRWFQGQESA